MKAIGLNVPKPARLGLAVVGATMMVALTSGEAAAKHSKHAHHHAISHQLRDAQASAAPETTSLPPMRYYGGPKSPMWR
jgi:hypothetical protein